MTLKQRVIDRAQQLETLYPQLGEEARAICKMMHEACSAFVKG